MRSSEDAATVAGAVLIVVDISTVAGRFYSRWSSKAGFRWDDWTILIAMLSSLLPAGLTIWVNSVSKMGPAAASNFNPDYVFTPADILYTKITFSMTVLYFFISCVTKFSILLLFHRIFAINKSFKFQIYAAEAVVVAFWFSATVADVLNCVPLEWTWKNGNADPRYCINYNTFWLVTGIFESVIDLGILVLPFGMVRKLQLDRNKKYGVAGIFLLGGFVLFSGVAKVVLSYSPNSRGFHYSQGALWTTVHLYTGIVCANLPPNRPLFIQIARVMTGLWGRPSSLRKRWYNLSSGQSFKERETSPRSRSRGNSQDNNNRPPDLEIGQLNYELAMYGRDGQIADESAESIKHSPRI